MSELIVIAFDGSDKANEVLEEIRSLQQDYIVELEDACVVIRDENGKTRIAQLHNHVGAGALGGGLWGVLVGLLFLHPLIGLLVGAAAGAAGAALNDVGIKDSFVKKLGKSLQPDSSALFVLFRKMTTDKFIKDIKKFKGTVMKTSLSHDDEIALRDALSAKAAEAHEGEISDAE